MEEKLELQEKVNQELYRKVNFLAKEMEALKQKFNSAQPLVPEPQVQRDQHHHEPPGAGQGIGREQGQGYRRVNSENQDNRGVYCEKQRLCESARRIVGFSPIDQRMLNIQMQSYGAKDTKEAMLMEVSLF